MKKMYTYTHTKATEYTIECGLSSRQNIETHKEEDS